MSFAGFVQNFSFRNSFQEQCQCLIEFETRSEVPDPEGMTVYTGERGQ